MNICTRGFRAVSGAQPRPVLVRVTASMTLLWHETAKLYYTYYLSDRSISGISTCVLEALCSALLGSLNNIWALLRTQLKTAFLRRFAVGNKVLYCAPSRGPILYSESLHNARSEIGTCTVMAVYDNFGYLTTPGDFDFFNQQGRRAAYFT